MVVKEVVLMLSEGNVTTQRTDDKNAQKNQD